MRPRIGLALLVLGLFCTSAFAADEEGIVDHKTPLRNRPSKTADQIASPLLSSTITIHECEHGWCQITSGDLSGWILGVAILRKSSAEESRTHGGKQALRENPNVNSEVVGYVQPMQSVFNYYCVDENKWCRVSYGGKVGWIDGTLLETLNSLNKMGKMVDAIKQGGQGPSNPLDDESPALPSHKPTQATGEVKTQARLALVQLDNLIIGSLSNFGTFTSYDAGWEYKYTTKAEITSDRIRVTTSLWEYNISNRSANWHTDFTQTASLNMLYSTKIDPINSTDAGAIWLQCIESGCVSYLKSGKENESKIPNSLWVPIPKDTAASVEATLSEILQQRKLAAALVEKLR